MRINCCVLFIYILLQLIYPKFTYGQHHESNLSDCNHNDALSILRSKQQATTDSMDWVNFKAATMPTKPCTTPSATPLVVHFTEQSNRINGYFDRVGDANIYIVLLHQPGVIIDKPLNGKQYHKGDRIGDGTIIACGEQTAFSARELKEGTLYGITVFAGNSNCREGIKYNSTPIFTGFKTTSATTHLNRYFGNLHSHSKNSDGNKENANVSLSQNYTFAKDADCMDFLGISDHNHFSSPGNPGMRLENYRSGTEQAQTFNNNNPNFLALYGMEFGVINNGGHVIVYGIDSLLGWETLAGSPNYDIYISKYDYLGNNGLFRTINRFNHSNAFGYFAHPDENDYGNLLGISYSPFSDSAIIGSALENGPANSEETNYDDYPSSMSYLYYYRRMLAKGYHIGPIIDHDNHYFTFGRTARSRVVVLSASLSKPDFMDAVRSRSFYATQSCSTILDFEVSGAGMGSVVKLPNAPAIFVAANDPNANEMPNIRVYKGAVDGNPATIVASQNGNDLSFVDVDLQDGQEAYYFVDMSIGNSRTISSPVWYRRDDNATTAVNQRNSTKQQITILENPVTSGVLSFLVDTDNMDLNATVQICDVYGSIKYRNQFLLKSPKNSLDVSSLGAGTYFLSVHSNKLHSIKKFVKY